MPALEQVHIDAEELPLDICSRAEGLPWVEASQQRRDRLIYSVFSVLIHEICTRSYRLSVFCMFIVLRLHE